MEESALVVPVLPPRLMFAGGMLRELRPSDASALLTYLSDPQVVEHTSIPTPTAESVRRVTYYPSMGTQPRRDPIAIRRLVPGRFAQNDVLKRSFAAAWEGAAS